MLLDELKKMKEELAKSEEGEKEIEIEEPEIEEVEEPEEPPVEEIKEEIIETPKEEKLDDAGYARLRREAAAEKRRAELAEKELAELRQAKEPIVEAQEQIQFPPEFQTVIEDHRISRAEREFTMLESKVKQDHPEYGAVAAEYAAALYQSFKVQNPRKSDIELSEMTKKSILMKAGEYARAGYENPVEEMYHEAKELGFTGKSFQKQESPKEEKLQPDMKKVADNRKRSSGMAASNGRSEGLMTIAAAADLTAAEWARLPIADKRRIMYGQ